MNNDREERSTLDGLASELMNFSQDALLIEDLDGVIIGWNEKSTELFQYHQDEVVGIPLAALLSIDFDDVSNASNDKSYGRYLGKLKKINNDFFNVKVLKKTILDSYGNKTASIYQIEILSCNKTEAECSKHVLKKQEDFLKKQQFHEFLNSVPDAIIIVNKDGIIELINQQTEKLFGYYRKEILGKKIEYLMPQKYRRNHKAYRNQFIQNPKTRYMGIALDLFAKKKNGDEFPVEISLTELQHSPTTMVSCAIRDITIQREQLADIKILLKEIHHRVKNNLQIVSSLLRLQSRNILDSNVLNIFNESQLRIQCISLVHEKTYLRTNLSEVNLSSYITDLAKQIISAIVPPAINCKMEFNCQDVYVDLETAIPLALIINEVIVNVFKHIPPMIYDMKLTIKIDIIDSIINIEISDNLQKQKPKVKAKISSLGMDLIAILSKQLDAKYEYKFDEFTYFKILINTLSKEME